MALVPWFSCLSYRNGIILYRVRMKQENMYNTRLAWGLEENIISKWEMLTNKRSPPEKGLVPEKIPPNPSHPRVRMLQSRPGPASRPPFWPKKHALGRSLHHRTHSLVEYMQGTQPAFSILPRICRIPCGGPCHLACSADSRLLQL